MKKALSIALLLCCISDVFGQVSSIAVINTSFSKNRVILTSDNRMFKLWYQSDGNLVIYNNENPIWASNTAGKPSDKLAFQSDGNLVIYNGSNPVWASNCHNQNGNRLRLEDNGNLRITTREYKGGSSCCTIWSTNSGITVPPSVPAAPQEMASVKANTSWQRKATENTLILSNKAYKLYYQADGNLVIYNNGNPVWASNTTGKPSTQLAFQSDGNLVIYNGSNPVWSPNCHNKGGAFMWLKQNGELGIYNRTNDPIWRANPTTDVPQPAPSTVPQQQPAPSPVPQPQAAPLPPSYKKKTGSLKNKEIVYLKCLDPAFNSKWLYGKPETGELYMSVVDPEGAENMGWKSTQWQVNFYGKEDVIGLRNMEMKKGNKFWILGDPQFRSVKLEEVSVAQRSPSSSWVITEVDEDVILLKCVTSGGETLWLNGNTQTGKVNLKADNSGPGTQWQIYRKN